MKRLFALALATLMVLSLVACGGGGTTSTPAGTGSTPAGTSSTPAGTDKPAEPKVEYKKEIVLTGGGSVFEHPDPQYTASSQNTRYAFMSHDRLVELDYATGELSPGLAKSWEVSADGLTYTFQLRDDVTFHNGEKFTADDVVFTVERGLTSPNANVVSAYGLATCEAQGDYTVVMKLAAINPDFLLTRSYAYMSILNREACEAAGADSELGATVGTGLWILKEFELNDYAVWERNDNFWGESTPTERITYRHIPEAAARAVAVETGEVDITTAITLKDSEAVAENKALEVVKHANSSPNYFAFNLDAEGPWQDINFRLACAYAINFDAVILGAADGNGTRANTFWGKVMFGLTEGKNAYTYDVEKAKDYLAKSTYKGEEIVCIALQSWTNQALIISDMFSKVGIKMRVDTLASADLSAKTREGQWEALSYTYTFNPNGSDMTRFLNSKTGGAIYNPDAIPSGNKIVELMDEAGVSLDDAKRKANYAEVQELMLQGVVVFPTYYPNTLCVQPAGTEGIAWNPTQEYNFRYVKVPVSK